MPSLENTLASIPGYGGFLAKRQQNQEQELGELQQASGLMGILKNIQAQQQQEQLKGVLAKAGGDPAKAVAALLQAGTPQSIELASKLKGMMPKPAEPYTLGNQRRGPNNELLAEAPFRPERPNTPSNLSRLNAEMSAFPEGDPRRAIWANAIRKESETAKQISPTVINQAPVTPVTIQDPNDPNSTIVIDGRTRKVLGKGPKMTEAGKIDAKTQLSMTGLGADLQSAEDLLTGVTRTSDGQIVRGNLPTGSGIGSVYDTAAGFFGASPSGAAEADSLKTVAARLVGRIPRFEGPQSDKDVKLYQQAAGDAGNEKLPRLRRLAAIKTMRAIYEGYESGRRGRLIGNRRPTDGTPDEPPPGAVRPRN